MFEDQFEDEKPEAREIGELCARLKAMPLQPIIALEDNGRIALLGCGHWTALLFRTRVEETIRCRDCYAVGMLAARRMVEEYRGSQ